MTGDSNRSGTAIMAQHRPPHPPPGNGCILHRSRSQDRSERLFRLRAAVLCSPASRNHPGGHTPCRTFLEKNSSMVMVLGVMIAGFAALIVIMGQHFDAQQLDAQHQIRQPVLEAGHPAPR